MADRTISCESSNKKDESSKAQKYPSKAFFQVLKARVKVFVDIKLGVFLNAGKKLLCEHFSLTNCMRMM